MNYIGHQVVGGDLLCGLRLFCQVLAQINIPIVHECHKTRIFQNTFTENKEMSKRVQLNLSLALVVTYVMGKLTIVGFFSTKKLFFVNRLMQKMRYGGSLVSWNLFRKFSLYVLYSCDKVKGNDL